MSALCSVEGCDRPLYRPTGRRGAGSHGLCSAHYQRWLKHGDVLADQPIGHSRAGPPKVRPRCSVEGCERPSFGRSEWCQAHRMRWKRTGDLRPQDPLAPYEHRTRICEVDGCDHPTGEGTGGWGGLCQAHHKRLLRHGDVQADVPLRRHHRREDGKDLPPCAVEGCDLPSTAAGTRCRGHQERWRVHGDTVPEVPLRRGGGTDALRNALARRGKVPFCEVEGCDRATQSSRTTLCASHARRLRDYGDVGAEVPVGAAPKDGLRAALARVRGGEPLRTVKEEEQPRGAWARPAADLGPSPEALRGLRRTARRLVERIRGGESAQIAVRETGLPVELVIPHIEAVLREEAR